MNGIIKNIAISKIYQSYEDAVYILPSEIFKIYISIIYNLIHIFYQLEKTKNSDSVQCYWESQETIDKFKKLQQNPTIGKGCIGTWYDGMDPNSTKKIKVLYSLVP